MPVRVALAAAVLALAGVVPVFAGAGLPRLGELQVGPYAVALYNDSPTLVTGRNLLTVEVPGEAAGATNLTLVAAGGQTLDVALNRVKKIGSAEGAHGDGHAASGTAGEAQAPSPPGHEASSHGSASADSTAGGHGDASRTDHADSEVASSGAGEAAAAGATLLRGKVNVPSAGIWTARVSVAGPDGEVHRDEIVLEASRGGPNRLYLFSTGTIIVAALMVGVVGQRRIARTASVRRSG